MCAEYGYKPGSTADAYASIGTADSLNQRAYTGPRMTESGWAYRMGVRGGRVTSGTPDVTLALWSTDDGANPDILVARTDAFTTGTAMLDAADGTSYERDLQTAAMLRTGKRYAPGFVAADERFGYGYLSTGDIPDGEYNEEHLRTVAGTGPTPQDPFGATSNTSRGWLAVWVLYEENVAPDVPTTRSPGIDAVIPGLQPTFEGDFRDDNETLPGGVPGGDQLARTGLRVYETDGAGNPVGDPIWSTTRNATAAERTARRFSVLYDGPALTPGNQYAWQCRVHDQFDARSDWSSLLLFTPGAGTVDVSAGTPTGKQDTLEPGPFTGVWDHADALDADRAGVAIYDATTGALVRAGLTILDTPVVVGDTISVDWDDVFPGWFALQWGLRYEYAMQARDTDGTWSDFSNRRGLSINAHPSIPDLVTPRDDDAITSRPVLVADVTDADDTPLTGLTVSARIKDEDGDLLFTRTMTHQSTRTLTDGTPVYRFAYTTTSTDLPTTGTYRWDAWAHDGTVYSSGNAVLGAAALSPERTFEYASGPAITHVDPVDGDDIATASPTYDWSVTGQTRYQVLVYRDSDDLLVWDSGEVETTATQAEQEPGYLENGYEYYRVVHAWNAANQHGISAPAFFTVDFSDPDPVTNFVASPHRARGDVTPTAILLSWDPTEYGDDEFVQYVVTRRASADTLFAVDDELEGKAVRIAEITSPGETRIVDYLPASGVTYEYGVKQVVNLGGQRLTSATSHAEGVVTFQETVICDAQKPGAFRIVLPAREDREWEPIKEQSFRQPWNSTAPTEFRTKVWYRQMAATVYPIIAATWQDAMAVVREGDALDQRRSTKCYRDGRGRRVLGAITDWKHLDPSGGRVQRVRLGFKQTSAKEATV